MCLGSVLSKRSFWLSSLEGLCYKRLRLQLQPRLPAPSFHLNEAFTIT